MNLLKLSIGLDVSKEDFKFCLGSLTSQLETSYSKPVSLPNNTHGVKKLIQQLKIEVDNAEQCIIVMEATGVYHELLAYALFEAGFSVAILLPNKAQAFIKSINQRAKTDQIDSQLLSQMGIERSLEQWAPPKEIYALLRSLTREKSSLTKEKVILKNKLHALETAFFDAKKSKSRLKRRLRMIEKQILEIETEIKDVIKSKPDLKQKVDRIEKIKGVSYLTVATIIAETNGFKLIRNQKQIIGYAGLDVRIHQSGSLSKKGKLSKKGNSHIRKALFMPAMCSSQRNQYQNIFYQQLNSRQASKKQGVIAVAKKLLVLIYALWKNETEYNPNKNVQNRLELYTV